MGHCTHVERSATRAQWENHRSPCESLRCGGMPTTFRCAHLLTTCLANKSSRSLPSARPARSSHLCRRTSGTARYNGSTMAPYSSGRTSTAVSCCSEAGSHLPSQDTKPRPQSATQSRGRWTRRSFCAQATLGFMFDDRRQAITAPLWRVTCAKHTRCQSRCPGSSHAQRGTPHMSGSRRCQGLGRPWQPSRRRTRIRGAAESAAAAGWSGYRPTPPSRTAPDLLHESEQDWDLYLNQAAPGSGQHASRQCAWYGECV